MKWIDIGPWALGFRSPVVGVKRPPKRWVCGDADCVESYAKPRRLTANGRCPRCGYGLRAVS